MKKMSACGEFADHLWKPGSCKNCFRPSSAHRSNSSLVHAKASADTDEDNCLNHSTSCSKPTIAVRPTVMNPDTLDMLTDVNMNTEQDNQKYVIDKLSLMEMLELAPFYRGKNSCSKTMKEVVMQNTASRKMDYLCRFSCNTLSLSAHKDESLFISSIQEEGHRPLGLKENGASSGFRLQVTDPVKSNSHTRGSVQEPERTTSSSGSSDGYRGIASAGLAGQKQEAALAIAIGIVTTAPTSPVRSRNKEPPNASDNLTLEHNCSCASSLAEPTGASDFCSYPTRMDSCSCLKGQSWSEKPQTLLFLPSLPSETKSSTVNSEPIYAESTKRKKKAFVGSPSLHCSALDGELAVDSQRAKNNTMTGNTGQPNSQILYLKSSGSPVSILFPHSSTSCKDSRCCNFQCCCSNTEANTGSFQSSPPIPPKRSSPKFETACLSPSPHPEVHLYPSVPTQFLYLSQTRNKAQGQVHTPIPPLPAVMALEPRNTLHTAQIEEEEGGKETVPQCGTPRYTNAATVLEPQDWSPTVHSKESTPPGTAHSGVSQPCLDKHKGSMLANGTSSTATLREGKTKTHDTMPPPPPPKKHHRVSSKMNKPTSDLEKTTWNDSVESFAQPLRILPGGLTTTSFEGLGSIPRIFSDGGNQGAPYLPNLSLCLTSSLVLPLPDPLPNTSPGLPLQPPPLPEKRLVNRMVSGPNSEGGRWLSTTNPRCPASRSEGDISGPDKASSKTMTLLNSRSSGKSQEPSQTTLYLPLDPQTLDQPLEKGNHLCTAVATSSSSSPPLSVPPTGSGLHLQMLLSNMDSREGVYSKLGGLYAESLRRLALKCEEHFTRSQRNPLRFDESNWSLFKLTCNKPCCDAADGIYYSASCASDPFSSYAVKICKSPTQDAKQGHLSVQQTVPPHFNLQQDCGHFIACIPKSMLIPDEADGPPDHSEQERVVVITREVPHQSAAGFVQEWAAFHQTHPEAYERRVCFLLLQLCNGLEHLKEHGVTHCDLCLENLLLVPRGHLPDGGCNQNHLPRLLVSGFAKAKRHSVEDPATDPLLKTDHSRLAPEILSATQYRKFDEFQTGILIYELLHQPNPFKMSPRLKERDYHCEDFPPIPSMSLYSAGLQRLAQLLLQPDPTKRIHIQEAKHALQSLLWGPRRELMEQQRERPREGPYHEGLLNWLDVKRALLMMKFAERSLEPEQTAELEDWLCCQYFSSAIPLYLCHTADLLYFK